MHCDHEMLCAEGASVLVLETIPLIIIKKVAPFRYR